MLISTISKNTIPLTTIFSQLFTFLLLSSHLLHATMCIIKKLLYHDIKKAILYHIMKFYVTTCHVMTIMASLMASMYNVIYVTWAGGICLICTHESEDAWHLRASAEISGESQPHMLHTYVM